MGALLAFFSIVGEGTEGGGEEGAMSISSTPTPSPPPDASSAASSAGEVASATRS